MRDNATVVVYSDEVMLPALRRCGVKEPELYAYGFFGCNDPIIPAEEDGVRYLYGFLPTLSSDRDFTTMGLYAGATADGRHARARQRKPVPRRGRGPLRSHGAAHDPPHRAGAVARPGGQAGPGAASGTRSVTTVPRPGALSTDTWPMP